MSSNRRNSPLPSLAVYRALILDADDSACFAIQNALKGFGFSFQSFAEPNDALAYAQQTAPDLWFVRIELPSMSGFSVFNKIKRNDATKDIPIILYASDVSEDVFDRHKTLRSKAEGYLKLPVSHEQVVAVVGDILTIDRTALADGREIEVEMTSEIEFDDDIEVVSDEELNGSEDDFDLAAMMDDGDAVDAELSRALGDLTFPDSHETDSQPTTSFGLSDRPQDLSDVAEATQSAVVEAATVAQPDRTLLPPPRSRIAVEPITPTQTESTATAIDSAPVGLASFAAQPDMPSSSVDIEATDNDDLAEASEMAQDDERKLAELAASLERNIETPGGSLNASISTEGTGLGQRREMLNLKAQLVKKDRELLSIRDELETAQRGTLDERRKTRELQAQIGEIEANRLGLEEHLLTAQEHLEAVTQDKATILRREEGLKNRLEAGTKRLRQLESDLEQAQAESAEQRKLGQQRVQTLEQELEQLRQQHESAERENRRQAEVLREHEVTIKNLQEREEEATAQLSAAREQWEHERTRLDAHLHEERERAKSQLAAELERVGQEWEQRLAAQTKELQQQLSRKTEEFGAQLEQMQSQAATERQQLQRKLETTVATVEAREQEISRLLGEIEQGEAAQTELRRSLGESQSQLQRESDNFASSQAEVAELKRSLEREASVLSARNDAVRRAQQALAIALKVLDQP